MPCWFYDKTALKSTPSIQDGIDHKTECRYRTEGAHLIVQVGSKLELGYNTLATGVVYFHRFYMFRSFKNFSPYITACCCLFLAGKAEETPKKSKEIIKIAKKFLNAQKLSLLGQHPRDEVMTMEKILLQTIKFDLKVQHPYNFLLKYPKYLKGDQRKKQKMVQMAWTFINDSLCTTLSIQWEPEIIAIAVMYLSSKLVKFKVLGWSHRKPSHKYWWEIFVEDLSIQIVEDICHQVLDIYVPLSRYYVKESPAKLEPRKESKNSTASQSNSCKAIANVQVATKDLKFENGDSTVITAPIAATNDPRLQSGCVYNHSSMDSSNKPVMNTSSIAMPEYTKLIPSPSTPTDPPPMDQSPQDNSQICTKPNIGRDPRDASKYSLSMAKFNPSATSSPPEPMEMVKNPMFNRGFSNVDNWQCKENRGFENSQNNENEHGHGRNRGFGFANNNYRDRSEGGPIRNRDFRNHGRNNHGEYGQNHCRRRGYENNNGKSDDHNEKRPMRNRGFGNAASYDNHRQSGNQLTGNRGFGNNNNNNSMGDDVKPFEKRGFRNNNNSTVDDVKPFVKRGFENSNNSTNSEFKPFEKRGFGNENCTDDGNINEKRFTERRGFGNRKRNDDRYSNENRFTPRRGFGNRNGNGDRNFNRFTENRGFGNGNHNNDRSSDDSKLALNRGFGSSDNNDDNKSDETKSFMNRGFGNSISSNNNYKSNDSRPSTGFNRGNHFQRSDIYPRKFNNNYENDRYSNNDAKGDISKGFERRDAPCKMEDKQRFYQPPKDAKVEEEESWD